MLDQRYKTCILAGKCGSMSEAAESLFLSKQAVKKQIDSLENESGITIFNRSSKGLELTPAGKLYLEGLESLTESYDRLLCNCMISSEKESKHSLNILQPAHPELYGIEAIPDFRARYPEIVINSYDVKRLFVHYNNQARFKTLTDGIVDVVFAPHDSKYDTAKLQFIKLRTMPYFCMAASDSRLAKMQAVVKEDLSPYVVRVNTVMDHPIYSHILDQERAFQPKKIIASESDMFTIPGTMSFIISGGMFITKGDMVRLLTQLSNGLITAVPFSPDFAVDDGMYIRKNAPEYVRDFARFVCRCRGVSCHI